MVQLNNMINKILNSTKLYTITILLSIVVCILLNNFVESRPNDQIKLKKDLKSDLEETTTLNSQNKDEETKSNSSTINNLELTTKLPLSSNRTNPLRYVTNKRFFFNATNFDSGFYFRFFVLISAFCFVIFIAMFIKSLNSQSVMYGYLDSKCGAEEKLMKGHISDFSDEEVMFDVVEWKRNKERQQRYQN